MEYIDSPLSKSFSDLNMSFSKGHMTTTDYFNGFNNLVNMIKSMEVTESVKFGEGKNSISVDDLMKVLVDSTDVKHYCDGLVWKGDRFLVIQRAPGDDFGGNKWALPGGKAELGEFLKQAVCREVFEETGLNCEVSWYETLFKNEDGSFSHYFRCNCKDPNQEILLDSREIVRYNWIKTDEIDQYDWLLDCGNRLKKIFNIPYEAKKATPQELSALANKINKSSEPEEVKENYLLTKKGCLMATIPFEHKEWRMILECIDEEDVYYGEDVDGLENYPHATILYGFDLMKVQPDSIFRLVPQEGISMKITGASCFFNNEEYDVLKFDLDSLMLLGLNSKYRLNFPYSNSHPVYRPHITIGYLKKGCGAKYQKIFKDYENRFIVAEELRYSYYNQEGRKFHKSYNIRQELLKDDIIKSEKEEEVERPPVDITNMRDEELHEYAEKSPEDDLHAIVKTSKEPRLREAAHRELDRRKHLEHPLEKEKKK